MGNSIVCFHFMSCKLGYGVRSVSGVRKSKGSGLGCGGGGVNWGWCHVNQTKYSRRNHGLRKKKVKENGEDI